MFNHIVLRKSESGECISIGQIAEGLLYYQKLHLIIDKSTLFELIKQIGFEHLLILLRRSDVSAVYCEEILAVNTNKYSNTEYHGYLAFRFSGYDGMKLDTPADRLEHELIRQSFNAKEVKAFVKKFLSLVPIRKFSGNHFIKGGIPEVALNELKANEYTRLAIKEAVENMPGGYKLEHDFKFEIFHSNQGFCVFTSIDFNLINKNRSELQPPIEAISMAHLFSNILDSQADIVLASFYGGDFVTSDVNSSIIQVRHEDMLRRTKLNNESQKQFIELVLPDTPSLREVIDSGERSIAELLKLLDQSVKFKEWLGSVNPDENLIRTYMKDVSSEGWIQKLPAKSVRYILTTAIEAKFPVTGIVSGVVDNFILDKLLSGWRPNHFISKKLSPFVSIRN